MLNNQSDNKESSTSPIEMAAISGATCAGMGGLALGGLKLAETITHVSESLQQSVQITGGALLGGSLLVAATAYLTSEIGSLSK